MSDETDSQQGQEQTPENSPGMTMLMESMEAALGGLAHSQQEAANQVPTIRAEHDRLQTELASAYEAEDFKRYDELSQELEALERIWQITMHMVGPNPEAFGLGDHPALVDPDS